eukprot:PhM_4_TR57/c0_g1_i1/m.46192
MELAAFFFNSGTWTSCAIILSLAYLFLCQISRKKPKPPSHDYTEKTDGAKSVLIPSVAALEDFAQTQFRKGSATARTDLYGEHLSVDDTRHRVVDLAAVVRIVRLRHEGVVRDVGAVRERRRPRAGDLVPLLDVRAHPLHLGPLADARRRWERQVPPVRNDSQEGNVLVVELLPQGRYDLVLEAVVAEETLREVLVVGYVQREHPRVVRDEGAVRILEAGHLVGQQRPQVLREDGADASEVDVDVGERRAEEEVAVVRRLGVPVRVDRRRAQIDDAVAVLRDETLLEVSVGAQLHGPTRQRAQVPYEHHRVAWEEVPVVVVEEAEYRLQLAVRGEGHRDGDVLVRALVLVVDAQLRGLAADVALVLPGVVLGSAVGQSGDAHARGLGLDLGPRRAAALVEVVLVDELL